ncbi:hypothetical protein L596_021366 [Steinernema carpocapsae]|uniref:Uncharacterized protein n=1 Tax=Steinernema carpocapsae TaxID=34508 RepID=A0A4U5MIJ8_STECR|nr:hypothetical protein L596_021366 [Steinernema carpocapsae]
MRSVRPTSSTEEGLRGNVAETPQQGGGRLNGPKKLRRRFGRSGMFFVVNATNSNFTLQGTSAAIGLNRIAENCNLSTSNIENLLRSAITNMLIIGYGFVGIFAIYTLSQCILIWYKLQSNSALYIDSLTLSLVAYITWLTPLLAARSHVLFVMKFKEAHGLLRILKDWGLIAHKIIL